MAFENPDVPRGHGEVLTRPPYERWAEMMRSNAALAETWDFEVAGRPAAELRARARAEALDVATGFSARLGVEVSDPGASPELIVMTGHQPQLYHPGVWAKDFLLQRIADETGAAAIDSVVDSDEFMSVEVVSPCMRPTVSRCRGYLAIGGADTCYASAAVPSARDVEAFCEAGEEALSTLRAPAIGRHFARFCEMLRQARADSENVAELVTIARRRYEAAAGTTYLELPVSMQSRTGAFAAFFADIALRAEAFAEIHNSELRSYRERNRLRSKARPFPDLRRDGDLVELPFWHLGPTRSTVWVRPGKRPEVVTDGKTLLVLPPDPREAAAAAAEARLAIAPKAVTLTLFGRTFVSDLFIHGTGGARYDLVTDAVARRFYGVEPLRFVIASMTMYLPLGVHAVTTEEVEAAEQKLNRLAHNPDQLLDEWRFEDPAERAEACALAEEKGRLTAAIRAPGADKKALGGRIREVNERLSASLEPFADELARELRSLKEQAEAADVMTDRTYPFCFWSPEEVAHKLR